MAQDNNEKEARAPDDGTGGTTQGEVRRGKTRDAFAFRDFPLIDFVRSLQTECGIARFSLPVLLNDKVVDFRYTTQRQHEYEDIAYWGEIKKNVEEYESKLRKFSKKILRHMFRLESRIKYLKGEELELWIKDISKIKTKSEPYYGGKESRLACLLDEYLFLSDFAQMQIISLGRLKIEVEEHTKTKEKRFSQRLRFARQKKKLTQSQLATKLGLSRVGYAPYELGKRDPTMTMLITLSGVLDVSVDWLCGLKD